MQNNKIMLLVVTLCLLVGAWGYRSPPQSRSDRIMLRLSAEPEEPSEEKKQSTRFARGLDDFVGKRYGAGEAFYGKRKSEMSEEDFQAMRLLRQPKQEEKVQDLKNNAVMVVGGIDDVNMWVAFAPSSPGIGHGDW